MKGGSSGGILRLVIAAIAAVLLIQAVGLFPGLSKLLTAAVGIVSVAIVVLLAAMFLMAFKKPAERKPETSGQLISRGRRGLMELRSLTSKIKNSSVQALAQEIIDIIEKILAALKNEQMDLSALHQFFNYYMPTLIGILKKYISIEESGSAEDGVVQNTVTCLADIKKAMKAQHDSILEHKILDMSVEMEALTQVCRRDGLLGEDQAGGAE